MYVVINILKLLYSSSIILLTLSLLSISTVHRVWVWGGSWVWGRGQSRRPLSRSSEQRSLQLRYMCIYVVYIAMCIYI